MGTTVSREKLIAFVRETHRLACETDVVERAKAGREVSPSTSKDYARVGAARIDLSQKSGGALMEGVSRQSWDHHRAALRHEAAKLFSQHRAACDKAQRQQKLEEAAVHARQARRALRAFLQVTHAEKPAQRTKSRKSKRKTLPRDSDWQLRAFKAATPAMRPALALSSVGARPQEIELGAKVTWIKRNGQIMLKVVIKGAKITEYSGQPERTLLVDPTSREGQMLRAIIPQGARSIVVQRKAKRISLDWSQRIRPAVGSQISAYSLRHQFAANLKAAGFDPIEIAKALGHLSIKSQQRYGSKQQGQSGGVGLVEAEASRAVKIGLDAEQVTDPFDL